MLSKVVFFKPKFERWHWIKYESIFEFIFAYALNTFPIFDSSDMGWKSARLLLLSFFLIGIILADFHQVRNFNEMSGSFFSIKFETPSIPYDFLLFTLLNVPKINKMIIVRILQRFCRYVKSLYVLWHNFH